MKSMLPTRATVRLAFLAAGRAALAFLFPDSCLTCGRALREEERHLCGPCLAEVVARPASIRLLAGLPIGRIDYALEFDGPVRDLVRALKYDGRTSAADPLAAQALRPLSELLVGGFDALVPVPLHAVRLRERGFNQSRLLAAPLANAVGLELLDGLIRRRATPSQVGLAGPDRFANVRGAFAGTAALVGRRAIVLDDVVTTGATLAAACEAALAAGARGVAGFAVSGPGAGGRRGGRVKRVDCGA
jgi:ComF family protein